MSREIDAQVIERVMGWPIATVPWSESAGLPYPYARLNQFNECYRVALGPNHDQVFTFCPTENIADAWQVIEKLRAAHWLAVVKDMPEGFPYLAGNDWTRDPKIFKRSTCEFSHVPRDKQELLFMRPYGIAESPALAICIAALDCVEKLKDAGLTLSDLSKDARKQE